MKKFAAMCVTLMAMACCASVGRAAVIINVGDHALLPNTPNQKVPLYVTGGTHVIAVAVECEIGDGGPLAGGVITGPAITRLDVIDGTIFAGHNNGQTGSDTGVIVPQVASRGTIVDLATDYVVADGLFATVTIDTTGFNTLQSTWELRLQDTVNGNTTFGEITPTIYNGSITILGSVPEPGTLLLAMAGAGLLMRRRRAF